MIGNHMVCSCCEQELVDYESLDHTYCTECNILIDAAEQAISIARRIGVPRYGPSSWKEISTNEHLEHAATHLNWAQAHIDWGVPDSDEDHLAHAICRLVMARAMMNENTSSS